MHGEEADIEALQAQIDLSNSVTYDLVSSWMKPTSSKPPTTSVSSSIARELQEHAKRPPRLGLGASVSKANAATAREAAKLKGKLSGTKRTRDVGGEAVSASASGQAQEEDDGESRSAAISIKKFKVNGTGVLALGPAKKDKKKGRDMQKSTSNGVEAKPDASIVDDRQAEEEEEWHGFSVDALELIHTPDNSAEQSVSNHSTPNLPSKIQKSSKPSSNVDLTSPLRPTPSPSRNGISLSPTRPNKLLNLDGPPLSIVDSEDTEEGTAIGSLKRKRHRRRRGKGKKGLGNEEE